MTDRGGTEDHDVVVIGGGHNGLACAAYLARAGLDTHVLDARESVGGCASTEHVLGARVNICNCDHLAIRSTQLTAELDLARHGLDYLEVEPSLVARTWSGSTPWAIFHDAERTLEGLARTHPDQVDGYRRYLRAARPVAEMVLDMTATAPSVGAISRQVARRRGKGAATLLRWSRQTTTDILGRFFTDPAMITPALATGPAVWGLAPQTPRTGLGALSYATRHLVATGRPRGGSGALTDALRGAVEAAGGTIRTNSPVTRILCDRSRVRGVEVEGDEVIEARVVVAACDPRAALVEWLTDPPSAARAMIDRWRQARSPDGFESKLDAVLSEAPRLPESEAEALAEIGVAPQLASTTVIAPDVDGMAHAHAEAAAGRVAERPIMLANCPTVLDPTMGDADGGHVLSLEVLFTPYALAGGWRGSAEPERWLSAYAAHVAPGLLESVKRWRVMTPPDYEEQFRLPRGYAPSYSGGPLAALAGRDRELTRYETPVKGLYLTGAATFPGAGIWGSSGRNAAAVIIKRG